MTKSKVPPNTSKALWIFGISKPSNSHHPLFSMEGAPQHATALPSIQMNLRGVREPTLGRTPTEPPGCSVGSKRTKNSRWQMANGQSFHDLATGIAGLR